MSHLAVVYLLGVEIEKQVVGLRRHCAGGLVLLAKETSGYFAILLDRYPELRETILAHMARV